MNEKKRVFNGYLPFDYRHFARELQEQAREGWILDHWGRFYVTYKHTGNKNLQPKIDIFTGAYEQDPETKVEAFRKAREKAGWKYAAESDLFYVWYGSQKLSNALPEPAQEKDLCHKISWSREMYVLGFTLVILFFGAASLWKMAYTDFLTFSGLGSLLLAPILLLPVLAILLYELPFIRKCKKTLAAGQPLEEYPHPKTRYRLIYGLAIAEAALVVLMFVLDAIFGYTRYLLFLLPVLAAVLAIIAIRRLPNPAARRMLSILVVIVCGVIFWNLRTVKPATDGAPDPSTAYMTAETLSEKAEETSYTHTVSAVVPYHYVYTEKTADGTKIATEYFRIPSEFCQKIVWKAVFTTLQKGKMETEPVEAAPWNADEAWRIGDNAILFQRAQEIYYYTASDGDKEPIAITPDMLP